MLRLQVADADRVKVIWVSANSPRTQGLGLRLRRRGIQGARGRAGLLRVDDIEAPAIMLWMDTATPTVEVLCGPVDDDGELQISNRWRLDDGREDEWLNNYGMVIDSDTDDTFVLRCSDGFGAPSFDDLVVRIDHLRRARWWLVSAASDHIDALEDPLGSDQRCADLRASCSAGLDIPRFEMSSGGSELALGAAPRRWPPRRWCGG